MKQTIKPSAPVAAWDAQALYDKALRYMQQTAGLDSDQWDYGLWTSFSLELLVRAALANIQPALLAEHDKTGAHLISALGFTPIEKKYSPRSIDLKEVFRRLVMLVPDFLAEHESFGAQHAAYRNAELHSGLLGFDGVKGSSWQPRFYQTCAVLLSSMGLTLEEFVGADEAKAARALIAAAADESAKAIKSDVDAHRRVWLGKSDEERTTLGAQASLWATQQAGHRVNCPACQSEALVIGEPVSAPVRKLENDEIIEKQDHLPNQFECIACGLRFTGLSRLTAVGLSDRYTKTERYDAVDFYTSDRDEYMGYEDDNNEY